MDGWWRATLVLPPCSVASQDKLEPEYQHYDASKPTD
jgi:hypothetical protein